MTLEEGLVGIGIRRGHNPTLLHQRFPSDDRRRDRRQQKEAYMPSWKRQQKRLRAGLRRPHFSGANLTPRR